jgi:hypothetical protein
MPGILHWGLRIGGTVLGRLLALAERAGVRKEMETGLRRDGVTVFTKRTESVAGKVSFPMTLRGESLFVLLEKWSDPNGFTQALDSAQSVGAEAAAGIRATIAHVARILDCRARYKETLLGAGLQQDDVYRVVDAALVDLLAERRRFEEECAGIQAAVSTRDAVALDLDQGGDEGGEGELEGDGFAQEQFETDQ